MEEDLLFGEEEREEDSLALFTDKREKERQGIKETPLKKSIPTTAVIYQNVSHALNDFF